MKIKILTNSTTPAAVRVREILESSSEAVAALKSVIGNLTTGKIPVYIDSVASANLYGYIKEKAEEEDEALAALLSTEEGVESLIEDENYKITITGQEGKYFIADMTLTETVDTAGNTKSSMNAEIRSLADDIVAKGIRTKEDMDAVLEYMDENHVDPYLQIDVLNGHRQYSKPICTPYCLYKDPYLKDSLKKKKEPIISKGLRAAVSGHAIILEGDKSVGKNVYADTILWLLGKPKYLVTFSRQMSPSSIYGEKTTDNSAAAELAAFDSNILAKASIVEEKRKFALNLCYKMGMTAEDAVASVNSDMSAEDRNILEQAARFRMLQAQSSSVNIIIDQSELYDWLVDGGGMIFNEMNLAEANFFASFTNQLLDGTGFLFIPGRGEVSINPDCVLFGTQNAEYQGCELQNEATMSRFGCITFPQPKEIKTQLKAATEAAIKNGRHPSATLDKKYYDACQSFYSQCSNAVRKGVVTNSCLNIRGFVRACQEVAESHGYTSLSEQIEVHVINTCPTDDRMALLATLDQMVTI